MLAAAKMTLALAIVAIVRLRPTANISQLLSSKDLFALNCGIYGCALVVDA